MLCYALMSCTLLYYSCIARINTRSEGIQKYMVRYTRRFMVERELGFEFQPFGAEDGMKAKEHHGKKNMEIMMKSWPLPCLWPSESPQPSAHHETSLILHCHHELLGHPRAALHLRLQRLRHSNEPFIGLITLICVDK